SRVNRSVRIKQLDLHVAGASQGGLTMRRLQQLTIPIVVVYLSCTAIARADAVTDWNAIAVQATTTAVPARPVAATFLDIAMVQAAVYDAVEAIDGRFRPYHVVIPGASGAPEAAAAKAAHDVLVNRFPDQAGSLDTAYHEYLASHGL